MENTVTLSLESYNELRSRNEELITKFDAINKGYTIHIENGEWFSPPKRYKILNASESDKKLLDRIFELEKENQQLKLDIHDIKKCKLWQLIKYKFSK